MGDAYLTLVRLRANGGDALAWQSALAEFDDAVQSSSKFDGRPQGRCNSNTAWGSEAEWWHAYDKIVGSVGDVLSWPAHRPDSACEAVTLPATMPEQTALQVVLPKRQKLASGVFVSCPGCLCQMQISGDQDDAPALIACSYENLLRMAARVLHQGTETTCQEMVHRIGNHFFFGFDIGLLRGGTRPLARVRESKLRA